MATLFKVIHTKSSTLNETLGVFSFKSEAEEYLNNLIEEYHEEIGFEEDYYHMALENSFWSTHKIVPFNR